MANITIKNLSMIFGHKQQVKDALQVINQNLDTSSIRETTGATVALKNVFLDIKDGELFVIVGLSGSGKSTLIRCLNLLNKPTQGEIFINNQDITKFDEKSLIDFRRNQVSMVFQNFGLLSHRNVIKNVEYGLEIQNIDKEIRQQKALEVLEVVGLKGWENMRINQLSGGMKQRVGIARALIMQPEILLMDEPYSALDPLIRRDMQNELLGLEDYISKTIVFITHDMNEAFKLGDRIALMKDGEIVQVGTPQEFFEKPADAYVKNFIADVDKTQIYRARNVLEPTLHALEHNTTFTKALNYLNQYNLNYIYVTDENKTYLGYVTKASLDIEHKRGKIIDQVILPFSPIRRHDYLKDVIKLMDENLTSIPVVDGKNRLRGVVTKDAIIQSLS